MTLPLIFVTGATGFIGFHVASQALQAGYSIRLSVRKESQISTLRKHFSDFAANVDIVVIPDLAKPGAFDKALQGVSYIFHLASPMPGKGSDFETDYVNPAVQGTISLLNVAKGISTIKRVVVVSSLLALIPLDALRTHQFHAKEGLNASIGIDSRMKFPEDPMASAGMKYHASKILAHRATLEWTAKEKPHFNVITLHPSFVFGQNLTQTSPEALDGTNAMLWGSLYSQKPLIPLAAVDVRDVALAHLRALEIEMEPKAEVEEFLLSASEADGWTWDRVVDFVREKYPSLNINLRGPFQPLPTVENDKAKRVLGLQWRKMEDTVSSFLDHQMELRSRL